MNTIDSNMEPALDIEQFPWPVYRPHIKIIKINKKINSVTSYEVECVHCKKLLTLDDRSTSNFRKHLSVS